MSRKELLHLFRKILRARNTFTFTDKDYYSRVVSSEFHKYKNEKDPVTRDRLVKARVRGSDLDMVLTTNAVDEKICGDQVWRHRVISRA
jgi:hypothetical protein